MSEVRTKGADEKFCESCGEIIKQAAEICPKCGVRQKNSPFPTATPTNYQFLKPYYQVKFDQIKSSNGQYGGGWNWASFLFGGLWALVKGLWINALVMFLLCCVTLGLASIPIWIYYGIRGNNLMYQKHVLNKNPQF